jgi:hexulose-6-phosphate isomerase
MQRRTFLKSSTTFAFAGAVGLRGASQAGRVRQKGYKLSAGEHDSKRGTTLLERFRMLRAAGFAGVEFISGLCPLDEILAARDATGLEIASVLVGTAWTHPLSHPNPATRATTVESLKRSLGEAKTCGASSVLLVPGVVSREIAYEDAYTRSMAEIKKVVPFAEQLGVAIAIENVWNKFLLSPLEAAAFVDAFKSPAVRWHFDVGNVVDYGWPEQWIRTLGSRIAKVHLKEFSRKLRDEKGPTAGFQTDLMAGDVDWPAVMAALNAAGYAGWVIAEQYRPPNLADAEWYARLAAQMDRILAS